MASIANKLTPKKSPWRALRWGLAAIASLLLLLAAYAWYVVASFDTKTLPARYGMVDARLFAGPEGSVTKRPLIVGLGGAEGGNAWANARWKSQRDRFIEQGYAVLAVGYFGLPNTPEKLDRIALEGIHAAVLKAALDPRINASCIAVIGGSRGGELALLLGRYFDDISTVVALVPGSAVFPSLTEAMVTPGFALNRQPLPFVPMPWSATPELITGNLRGAFEKMMANASAMQTAAIAVEHINGPVLLVSATQDEFWPSKEMSDAMMARLAQQGFKHVHEHWPVVGGHSEPLDEFPRIEQFLDQHFAPERANGGCR